MTDDQNINRWFGNECHSPTELSSVAFHCSLDEEYKIGRKIYRLNDVFRKVLVWIAIWWGGVGWTHLCDINRLCYTSTTTKVQNQTDVDRIIANVMSIQ
mmetsp:Transcript_24142/g.66901  ORF Transcript_24142/g.66901 Transcript_24142/m.66901 type:complete len:99 (+) Transcript_24142:282-578(+)